MAVRCLYCGMEFDVTLFEFNRSITCVCGKTVTFKHEQMTEKSLYARTAEDRKVREVRTMADRIAFLIVASDYPLADIEKEKQKLKEIITDLFPDRIELYDLIYEPRFRRLQDQFRDAK